MKRKAFTLVELMVVISIIVILAAILLQTIGGLLDSARTAKTRSILWRLRVQKEHKEQALDRLFIRKRSLINDSIEMAHLRLPAYSGLSASQKRVLCRKLMSGHYFPQNQSEMWDAMIYPVGTTTDDALLKIPVGNWMPDDDLTLVDGWGHRIIFFRWPTRLFEAHPEFLQYNKDPDDPLSQMAGLWTPEMPLDSQMPILMPDPCKPHIMVYVSPGPDGMYGLDDIDNGGSPLLGKVTNEDALSDNLWSFQR